MESTWESLSDRSERSSCFHQSRREQRQEDDEEEECETQLRSSSGQRLRPTEESRDSWEGTADILSSDFSWVTGLMNCVYYSENQQEPQGPPGETSTIPAARTQVCAAALFTEITSVRPNVIRVFLWLTSDLWFPGSSLWKIIWRKPKSWSTKQMIRCLSW